MSLRGGGGLKIGGEIKKKNKKKKRAVCYSKYL